jgi:hypothetical protein
VPLPKRWTGYSQHSKDCTPLPTYHITAPEVLRFRDAAFLKYHTDPGYLGMVRRRFGPDTVAHIEYMAGRRLERDLLAGKADVPPATLPRAKSREPAAPAWPLASAAGSEAGREDADTDRVSLSMTRIADF